MSAPMTQCSSCNRDEDWHYARKPTWLYVNQGIGRGLYQNTPDGMRPNLWWGKSEPKYDPAVVARMGLKRAKRLGEVGARGGGKDSAPRIGTPPAFRDLLLSIAGSATQEKAA